MVFFSETFRCVLVLLLKEANLLCCDDYHIKGQDQNGASWSHSHQPSEQWTLSKLVAPTGPQGPAPQIGGVSE